MGDDANEPLYRGSHMLSRIEALREVAAPEVFDSVMARITPQARQRIRETFSGEWLPLSVDVELSAAIFDEMGEEGGRSSSRYSVLKSMTGPLLGPLAQGTVALFGVSPRHFFAIAPRGWTRIYRNVGFMHVQQVTNGSNLHLTELPDGFFERGYLDGVAGGFEGVLRFRNVPGEVGIENVKLDRPCATLAIRWSPDGVPPNDAPFNTR